MTESQSDPSLILIKKMTDDTLEEASRLKKFSESSPTIKISVVLGVTFFLLLAFPAAMLFWHILDKLSVLIG